MFDVTYMVDGGMNKRGISLLELRGQISWDFFDFILRLLLSPIELHVCYMDMDMAGLNQSL